MYTTYSCTGPYECGRGYYTHCSVRGLLRALLPHAPHSSQVCTLYSSQVCSRTISQNKSLMNVSTYELGLCIADCFALSLSCRPVFHCPHATHVNNPPPPPTHYLLLIRSLNCGTDTEFKICVMQAVLAIARQLGQRFTIFTHLIDREVILDLLNLDGNFEVTFFQKIGWISQFWEITEYSE